MTTFFTNDRERITIAGNNKNSMELWATAFDYGDGRLGLSYNCLTKEKNPHYRPPRIELGEAVGAPVSYASAECGDPNINSERVYMISEDGGKTFKESGRCPLSLGSFANIGFPDGRILGLNVGRINEEGTGWCDYISVKESTDGGSTWTEITRLLSGTSVYLWRIRRVSDGSFFVLASFYGTPWGPGKERSTRNTALPGETDLSRIQTFFLHSKNGREFSGPHYVLPGIGAHEYDMAELSDGRLLFIAGDVQATPVGRQFVTRQGDSFINGALLPIHKGAPEAPETNPQGGYVPESLVALPGDILLGSRRNKPYSLSSDLGLSWHQIENLPVSLYQPFMIKSGDKIINFGHQGGDSAFGQTETFIGADIFTPPTEIPGVRELSLCRNLSEKGDKYINSFTAILTENALPVAEEEVTFRITLFWNDDGSVCTIPQKHAPIKVKIKTEPSGSATVKLPLFEKVRDIHFAYRIDAVCGEAQSPMMTVLAMTPKRHCPHPYDAYFAEGTLFLSPEFLKKYPKAINTLEALVGKDKIEIEDSALRNALIDSGVLAELKGVDKWLHMVHAGELSGVLPQGEGDLYE